MSRRLCGLPHVACHLSAPSTVESGLVLTGALGEELLLRAGVHAEPARRARAAAQVLPAHPSGLAPTPPCILLRFFLWRREIVVDQRMNFKLQASVN